MEFTIYTHTLYIYIYIYIYIYMCVCVCVCTHAGTPYRLPVSSVVGLGLTEKKKREMKLSYLYVCVNTQVSWIWTDYVAESTKGYNDHNFYYSFQTTQINDYKH